MQTSTDNLVILIVLATAATVLMVVSFILLYVRNQNKLLQNRQALQQAQLTHQKELLQVVIESQEAERIRIGRDLHDDVGAAISSLRLIIEMFKPVTPDDHYRQFIKSSKSIIDKMMTDVRHISHNLSPTSLTYYGLAFAIEEHCSIINQTDRLRIDFSNNAQEALPNLSLPVATAIYRVLEELLNNTIKHAKANKARLSFLSENNSLVIAYEDDGIGMDSNQISKGIGLNNIESRLSVINAQYQITTTPGAGFSIKIDYPLS